MLTNGCVCVFFLRTRVVVAPVVFTPVPTLYVLSVSLYTSSVPLNMFNVKFLATPGNKKKINYVKKKKKKKRKKRKEGGVTSPTDT